jgi:hypothetical protein
MAEVASVIVVSLLVIIFMLVMCESSIVSTLDKISQQT